jgi:hypothetical protein
MMVPDSRRTSSIQDVLLTCTPLVADPSRIVVAYECPMMQLTMWSTRSSADEDGGQTQGWVEASTLTSREVYWKIMVGYGPYEWSWHDKTQHLLVFDQPVGLRGNGWSVSILCVHDDPKKTIKCSSCLITRKSILPSPYREDSVLNYMEKWADEAEWIWYQRLRSELLQVFVDDCPSFRIHRVLVDAEGDARSFSIVSRALGPDMDEKGDCSCCCLCWC